MAKKQTAGRDRLGKLAPQFARYNDDVLFGEVWAREGQLSAKNRSMITIAALMSAKQYAQLKAHLAIGKEHGITKQEAVEIVTHLAFYCGWPAAWNAFPLVEEVYGEGEQASSPLFGLGQENSAYEKYFVGKSYLNPLNGIGVGVFNVTFEPKCRNNWHIHKGGGQILLCTDGDGLYMEWGCPARKLAPGDVVYIAPGVKHWHGAADCWFSHIAIEIPSKDGGTEWCEPVSDELYNSLIEK